MFLFSMRKQRFFFIERRFTYITDEAECVLNQIDSYFITFAHLTFNTHIHTPDLGALSCDNLNTVEWKIVYCTLSMRTVLPGEPSCESSIFPWLHIVYHTHNICIGNHLN